MTDRIDLDELAESTDDDELGERSNPGDWLWRDDVEVTDGPAGEDDPDGDAAGEGASAASETGSTGDATGPRNPADTDGPREGRGGTDDDSMASRLDRAVPHVPRPNKDRPVGIPIEGGGAGGGRARGDASGTSGTSGESGDEAARIDDDGEASPGSPPSTPAETAASGPHGGDADDMTMALTYAAARRLVEPTRVFADAAGWADWVGIVGDVDAPTINKFQRDAGVDVDFFNGSGTGPGERLAQIGPHSMFFAERMVVVGIEGEEGIAREADWEFVPLATAAEKAGWELTE